MNQKHRSLFVSEWDSRGRPPDRQADLPTEAFDADPSSEEALDIPLENIFKMRPAPGIGPHQEAEKPGLSAPFEVSRQQAPFSQQPIENLEPEILPPFWIGLGFGLVMVGILWWMDPKEWKAPMCSLYRMTGYYCPGCGGLRAAHALLHGRLPEAWSYNPFLVLLLPWVGYGGVLWGLNSLMGYRAWPGRWLYGRWTLILIGMAAVAFGVLRNLPWEPFCYWVPGPAP